MNREDLGREISARQSLEPQIARKKQFSCEVRDAYSYVLLIPRHLASPMKAIHENFTTSGDARHGDTCLLLALCPCEQ